MIEMGVTAVMMANKCSSDGAGDWGVVSSSEGNNGGDN